MLTLEDWSIITQALENATIKGKDAHKISELLIKVDKQIIVLQGIEPESSSIPAD